MGYLDNTGLARVWEKIKSLITKATEQAALNKSSIGLQRKNYLMNNCSDASRNGISAKINDDGSVFLKGKNTLNADFMMYSNLQKGVFAGVAGANQFDGNRKWIPTGNYILSGGVKNVNLQIRLAAENNDEGRGYSSQTDDREFSVMDSDKYTWNRIVILSGFDYPDGVTIYPMVRDANITDGTYEPYKPDLQEQINALTARVAELEGKK